MDNIISKTLTEVTMPTRQPESRRKLLKVGLGLALFNALILNILYYRCVNLAPAPADTGSSIYLVCFCLSYLGMLSVLPIIFVYLPVLMLSENRRKACLIGGSIAYTIYLLILIIDSYVFCLYRFHLNHTVIEQVAGPGAGQVFELSFIIYILAAIVLVVLFLLEAFLYIVSYKLVDKGVDKLLFGIFGFGVLMFFTTQTIHAFAAANDNRKITIYDRYLPISKPANINGMLKAMNVDVPSDKSINLYGHKYNYPKNELADTTGNMNIVMIVLDSWTASTLDSTICPNIYKFSNSCSVFNNHYSGGNCTRNGLFSLIYGLPGTYWYDFRDQHITPVLFKEFKKNDYDMSLYPSASLRNPPFDKNAFYDISNQCEATEGAKAWQRDEKLCTNFIKYIKSRNKERPFFSLLFFDSLHSMLIPDNYEAPFTPTWQYPEYMNLNNETEPTPYVNLYKNMLNYVDNQFERVIAALSKEGLLKNTIIIVTGDHGQEFNENKKNFWGHNGNFSEYQLHVPMLYYSPNVEPHKYSHWTSHRDVTATLMQEVFKVKNPAEDYCSGKSLFNTSKREFMQVDGYNGLGIIDENKHITYVMYDGEYEILNSKLDNLIDEKFDNKKFNKVMTDISSFYENEQ